MCEIWTFKPFFALACQLVFIKTHIIESRCVYRTEKYTVCRRVRASFSPEILQAGAVKGWKCATSPVGTGLHSAATSEPGMPKSITESVWYCCTNSGFHTTPSLPSPEKWVPVLVRAFFPLVTPSELAFTVKAFVFCGSKPLESNCGTTRALGCKRAESCLTEDEVALN